MFMGPLEVSKPWATTGIAGVHRLLDRIWRTAQKPVSDAVPPQNLVKLLHKTIKKVSQDTANLCFNTAIAQMMIFMNEFSREELLYRSLWESFVLLLSPYAPHLGEELWQTLGHKESLAYQPWPEWDEELTKEELVTVVIQINGKVRSRMEIPAGTGEEEMISQALENERIKELLAGLTVRKTIAVPDKIVNLVAG